MDKIIRHGGQALVFFLHVTKIRSGRVFGFAPSAPRHGMLPRNLQSLALRSAARCTARSHRFLDLHSYPPPFRIATTAGFHSSSRWRNELPKSPFQTFVEVLREELKKSRELQDNVKQLQGDVEKFQDSEAMKKARAAYERARVRLLRHPKLYTLIISQLSSSIKENPKLRAAAEELKKTGIKVGDAVSEALKTMEESDVMRAVCVSLSPLSLYAHGYRFHVHLLLSPPPLKSRQSP